MLLEWDPFLDSPMFWYRLSSGDQRSFRTDKNPKCFVFVGFFCNDCWAFTVTEEEFKELEQDWCKIYLFYLKSLQIQGMGWFVLWFLAGTCFQYNPALMVWIVNLEHFRHESSECGLLLLTLTTFFPNNSFLSSGWFPFGCQRGSWKLCFPPVLLWPISDARTPL